jgi:hypothetical protein
VASADPINEWAARVTKGLITTAVPPGTAFDLVLTNAVYFKGRCMDGFVSLAAAALPALLCHPVLLLTWCSQTPSTSKVTRIRCSSTPAGDMPVA